MTKYFLVYLKASLQVFSISYNACFIHWQCHLYNWMKPASNSTHWKEHEAVKLTQDHIYVPPQLRSWWKMFLSTEWSEIVTYGFANLKHLNNYPWISDRNGLQFWQKKGKFAFFFWWYSNRQPLTFPSILQESIMTLYRSSGKNMKPI